VGLALAWTGAVKDDILDVEMVAAKLMEKLRELYPGALRDRYGLPAETEESGYELLAAAARKRGYLVSGGGCDTERMARMLLDEFRAGKLGRITLERP
jgi:ribosome biogenesis GTPase A